MNLEKSLSMQEKVSGRIPGMTQLLSKRPDMFAPGVWPGYYSAAKGVEVWDLDGNRYIDMSIDTARIQRTLSSKYERRCPYFTLIFQRFPTFSNHIITATKCHPICSIIDNFHGNS